MTQKEINQIGDLLSSVLEKEPERLSLRLHEGWVNVSDLLSALHKHGRPLTVGQLYHAITAAGERLILHEDGQYLRARQTLAKPAEAQGVVQRPPEILHYGAPLNRLDRIREHGLPGTEHQPVRLSLEVFLPRDGALPNDATILVILAGDMYRAGYEFRQLSNNAWLVNEVPLEYLDFEARPWPHLVGQLLKRHTQKETFEILLSLIREQREIDDFVYLEYALLAIGLRHDPIGVISKTGADPGSPRTVDQIYYIQCLLNLARQSPYPKIRAVAVSGLPNLDGEGTRYALPESLTDLAARAIYAVKLGDLPLFQTLVGELISEAKADHSGWKCYWLQNAPLTLCYVIEARGPCIEIGGSGPDAGQRLPMSVRELYDLLRMPPTTDPVFYSKRFEEIIGNLNHRKTFDRP